MNTVKFQAKKYNSNTDLELDPVPELTSPHDQRWDIDETGVTLKVQHKYGSRAWSGSRVDLQWWSNVTQMGLEPEMEWNPQLRYNTNMDPEIDQDPELNPMFWSETQIRLEPEMECTQN